MGGEERERGHFGARAIDFGGSRRSMRVGGREEDGAPLKEDTSSTRVS